MNFVSSCLLPNMVRRFRPLQQIHPAEWECVERLGPRRPLRLRKQQSSPGRQYWLHHQLHLGRKELRWPPQLSAKPQLLSDPSRSTSALRRVQSRLAESGASIGNRLGGAVNPNIRFGGGGEWWNVKSCPLLLHTQIDIILSPPAPGHRLWTGREVCCPPTFRRSSSSGPPTSPPSSGPTRMRWPSGVCTSSSLRFDPRWSQIF